MQKIIPKKIHKSLPAFSLHSTRSFKVFQKNYPKNVSKLDIDCLIGRKLEPKLTKKIVANLTKLTKRSSKFKAIQDINLSQCLNASDSRALHIIKRFHRVQSLGLIWEFRVMKIQDEIRKWLKFTNRLRNLSFRQTEPIAGHQAFAQGENLYIKLAREIKRRKIKKIIHSVLPSNIQMVYQDDYYILNMNNFPSTIQEMSLDLSRCSLQAGRYKSLLQVVSMHKFSMLTRLELLFPLETEKALMILRTIPHPQFLTSLGLYLKNNSQKNDEQDLISIFKFIVECPELEKLSLKMTYLTNEIGILSRLSSKEKLRILNISSDVAIAEHFQDLGAVISSTINLESLDVRVHLSLDSISFEPFSEFSKRVSQLARLKKLCLNFTLEGNIQIQQVYPKLMDSLDGLNQLEELSLRFSLSHANLSFEFPSVIEGLTKIAHQLKKFSMDFLGNYFDESDELGLIEVLGKMKGLRELTIRGFSFKQSPESLLKFKEVLEGYEGLKKIKWLSFDVSKETRNIFVDLVRSILAKRGIEEVDFSHNYQLYEEIYPGFRKEILFSEILEQNPKLWFAKINSEIFSNNWYSHPFETCKYT